MSFKYDEQIAGWGIINEGGDKFCDYDSLDGFVDSASAEVPSEPQEGGSLFSYDKVRQANETTVTLLFNGDYSVQGASLSKLQSYLGSTDVFTIYTPKSAMENMTVVGINVSRGATSNANMLSVDVTFREVMSYYKKKKKISPSNPTSSEAQNSGSVQPDDMTGVSGGDDDEDYSEEAQEKTQSTIDKVTETFTGIKQSVTSAIATAKDNIESVRSTVSNYVQKARAVQNWARTQMTSISSEVSAVKSTFTAVKEVISFNGVKSTFWKGVNNAKSMKSSTKALLKEIGIE